MLGCSSEGLWRLSFSRFLAALLGKLCLSRVLTVEADIIDFDVARV